MLKEELCNSSEKFLQALMVFSDFTIAEWKKETINRCKNSDKDATYEQYMNWKPKPNEIAVFTDYAYADLSIPKKYNCLFLYNNPEIYVQGDFVLMLSVFEGWYPISCINHGCKHLCVLAFENEIPDILKVLHVETEKYSTWTYDKNGIVGICEMEDLPAIIESRKLNNIPLM